MATPTPPTDSIATLRERYGPRYRWLLLLSVMVGTMASIMSSTIVNVAIPDMSHFFTIGQERAQWVSSGFMVAMTVSMLTTPWLLARYGYRQTYSVAMWLLLVGGLVGGFSNHYDLVLLARVAEGLAAGVVQPIPAIIILRAFEAARAGPRQRHFWHGCGAGAGAGPQHWRRAGGCVFGWRSIFFMVVPFCVASLWLARTYVPVSAPGGVAANRAGAALDWRGLLLGSAGTLCLLNGLVALHGGSATQAGLLLGGAVAALVAFIWWQRRVAAAGREPLMNLALFGYRQFAMGSIVAFIYGTALFGSTYLLPVYLQLGLGLSPSHVGTLLLPAGVVLALTIAGVGRLADRQPTYLLVSIGLALLAVSFGLMVTVGLGTALWVLVAWAILGRIGLGFIFAVAQPWRDAWHRQEPDPAGRQCDQFCAHAGRRGRCQPVRHRAGMAAGGARRQPHQRRHQPGAAAGIQRIVWDAGRAVRGGLGGGLAVARSAAESRVTACANCSA